MEPIEIPHVHLSPEALYGILEEYATRGGFESSLPIEARVAQLRTKLQAGQLLVMFDPEEGLTNLVPASHSSR